MVKVEYMIAELMLLRHERTVMLESLFCGERDDEMLASPKKRNTKNHPTVTAHSGIPSILKVRSPHLALRDCFKYPFDLNSAKNDKLNNSQQHNVAAKQDPAYTLKTNQYSSPSSGYKLVYPMMYMNDEIYPECIQGSPPPIGSINVVAVNQCCCDKARHFMPQLVYQRCILIPQEPWYIPSHDSCNNDKYKESLNSHTKKADKPSLSKRPQKSQTVKTNTRKPIRHKVSGPANDNPYSKTGFFPQGTLHPSISKPVNRVSVNRKSEVESSSSGDSYSIQIQVPTKV